VIVIGEVLEVRIIEQRWRVALEVEHHDGTVEAYAFCGDSVHGEPWFGPRAEHECEVGQ
jgi:hypothetical protein